MKARQPTPTRVPARSTESAVRTIARRLLLAALALGSFAALPLDGSAAGLDQTSSAAPAIAVSAIAVAQDRPRPSCELPRRVALAEHVSPTILCTNPGANLRRR